MTQVRKPGGHGKVARELFFPTRSLERLVCHALPILKKILLFPSNLIFLCVHIDQSIAEA